MKKDFLEIQKNLTNSILMQAQENKVELEKDPKVAQYLNELKNIEREEKFQHYLSQLEIGKDDTVFGPYYDTNQKGLNYTHFGFSRSLKHAFALKYYSMKQFYFEHEVDIDQLDEISLAISYDEFDQYLNNAKTVLTDMSYVEGDPKEDNPYGLDLVKNPKNYSVVDFKAISSRLTEEQLHLSYDLSQFELIPSARVFYFVGSYTELQLPSVYTMTIRERDAFYGVEAQKALHIPVIENTDEKGKVYQKHE